MRGNDADSLRIKLELASNTHPSSFFRFIKKQRVLGKRNPLFNKRRLWGINVFFNLRNLGRVKKFASNSLLLFSSPRLNGLI